MRIAIDCRCIYRGMGGIGRYATEILREISTLDERNEYRCYFTRLEPPESLVLPKRSLRKTFETGMIDERFDQLIIPGLLEEDRVDLYFNPTFATPLIQTRARTVATVHDVVFRRHPDYVPDRLRDYLDRATDRSCRTADRLITVSAFSRSEISDLYRDSLRDVATEIEVIHNGVIPPPHRRLNESRTPRGHRYLLYVGSVEPKKNIQGLLEAFRTVTSATPHRKLKLMIAGCHDRKSFPIDATLTRLGLEGKVSLLGHVSEEALEDLYAHALIFIYPSFYEGFGLPPIEAMARGIPTIVSSTSSLPEVVGDGAMTVPPESPEDLARAILDLAGDERKRVALSIKGVQRAHAFTWKRSAEKHLALFESLAA